MLHINSKINFSLKNFIPNIYDTGSGKIYTLNSSFFLNDEHFLDIGFPNSHLEYLFYIHDPHFFISSINVAIPATTFQHNSGETLISKEMFFFNKKVWFSHLVLVLVATKFQLMDKEGERCEENEHYSFTTCIRVRKCPEKCSGIFYFLEFCQQDGRMSFTLGLLVRSNDTSLS